MKHITVALLKAHPSDQGKEENMMIQHEIKRALRYNKIICSRHGQVFFLLIFK